MVTSTLSKSVWEFAKSRAYVPCMPAWSTCPRDNVQNACQLLIITCQRANKRANVPKACQSFNFVFQKTYQFFNYFLKEFFNFWIFQSCSPFANFKNIWAILENLSRETKNLNFDICKISLRKNLVKLKPLTSFSIEHVGLTEQLLG